MMNSTDGTKRKKSVTFYIHRYDPDKDKEPRIESYMVDVRRGMTVLDGLHEIKQFQDQSLSFRYSCRMGICGSCAMLINGTPALACNTQILDVATNRITVAPLPNFRIVRDLVPDLRPMFEAHRSLKPHVLREDTEEMEHPTREYFQTPEQLEEYLQFSYCIKCGACMAACPTVATDEKFLGPMPLAAAYRYNADTRDDVKKERQNLVAVPHGVFNCHFAGECSRVCPKGVDPAKAIQHMKRSLVLALLRLDRLREAAKVAEEPKNAKRRDNIPEPPPFTVENAGNDA